MALVGREALDDAINGFIAKKNKKVRGIFFTGLRNIQFGTPIDEGTTRNNWFLTEVAPSTQVTNKKIGNRTLTPSALPLWVLDTDLFYTNNHPSVIPLEYGGYPNPVEKGSYVKKTKSYEVRSVGGFSKQAPSGWVRAEIQFMRKAIRNIK